jgi:hypothetical protein
MQLSQRWRTFSTFLACHAILLNRGGRGAHRANLKVSIPFDAGSAPTCAISVFINRSPLFVNRTLGVTNDVDKQDMRDFELDFLLPSPRRVTFYFRPSGQADRAQLE